MLDFSLNTSSFYLQKLAINSVYPDFVKKFHSAVNLVSNFLNIQHLDYQLTTNNQLISFAQKHKLAQLNALSSNGCLTAIKRKTASSPDTILNLSVLPFYFKLNLKNISAKAIILPISKNKSIIWSNILKETPEIDEFDSLAVNYLSQALSVTQKNEKLQFFKQEIENQFQNLIPRCQDSNTAYFMTSLKLTSAQQAIKLQQALYIENILVSTVGSLVQILLKPWHTESDVEKLINLIAKKLEKISNKT